MAYRSRAAYLHGLRGNIWKSYLFSALRAAMVIMPIIVLFFQDIGLSMEQVFLTQAAFSVVLIALEIPSGYLSDLMGRRKTLILGGWFAFFGFLAYVFAHGFWEVFLAEILLGVGASLISGTDVAMLYDTLAELREQQTYKRREGRRQGLARLLEGASAVAGGLLAAISFRLPFAVQAGVAFLLILIGYTFTEPETRRYRGRRSHLRNMRDMVVETLRLDRRLRWLVLYSAVVAATTLTGVWLLQPYFQAAGLPVAWFGVVWAAMLLVAAIVSFAAHRVDETFGAKRVLFLLMALPFAASLLLALRASLWLLLVIPAYQAVRALQGVVVADYLNRRISSETRATILSARNFLYRLLFAVLGPVFGAALDRWGVQAAFLASGVVFAVLGLLAFAVLSAAQRPARAS